MKAVAYTSEAARALRKHGNMAARLRRAMDEFATDPKAHANNVRQLAGSSAERLRVGDLRVVFEESEKAILVTKVAPRGDVCG